MPRKIFVFCPYNLSKPFEDMGVIYIVIITPLFIACIIRGVNVYTIDSSLIFGQKSFESSKIIPVDYFVDTMCWSVACWVTSIIAIAILQHAKWYFHMMG